VTRLCLGAPNPRQREFLLARRRFVAYGGARGGIDFASGELRVDCACYALTGTERFALYDNNRYVISLAGLGWESADTGALTESVSSHYRFRTNSDGGGAYGCFRISAAQQLIFGAVGAPFADADAFRAYLAAQYAAGTPVQICYKTAEPAVYRLAAPQIETLFGQNFVRTDLGAASVTYRADPSLLLASLRDGIAAAGAQT